MKILPTLPPSLAALFATVLLTLPAHAQGDRWFRVELLVFSHETGSADRAESWEPTPNLRYPDSVRFLVDDAQVKRNIQTIGQDSLLDARGVQTIKLPLPDSALNSRSSTSRQSTDIPRQNSAAGDQASSAGAAAAIDPQGRGSALLPAPFVQRPAAEREFHGKAAYMQRTGNYRTLYHHTWLHPMRDESSALPIVLDRSGDTRDWPALQGSVKIYLSRYLHIETNLWLNTTGNYLPGQWAMPPAPLGPPSLIVIEPEISQPEPLSVTNDNELVSETDTTLEPAYPWRHAVRFTEKRRMRSNEVHYLDHPMLGVVVKFTPVPQEELQAIAEADRAASAAAL
ncbi:MAG: CsiV family protein [Halioglobus sp.]